MKNEYHFHINGKPEKIREALNLLDGVIQNVTTQENGDIQIAWKPNPNTKPFDKVIQVLQSGNRDDGILLLELFLSNEPDDENILFNLGMAYSDAGEINHAIELLSRLIQKNSNHTHGRVALGVALLRARKTEEGIRELQTAVSQKSDDPWARRNLGAGLMQVERFTEAVEHLHRATELNPNDQVAWFGYGQALQHNGQIPEADSATSRQ